MVTCGNYNLAQQLARHGNIETMFADRHGGGADAAAVARVLRTADSEGIEAENPQAMIVEFLDAAKLQQRLAANSRNWAKVIETGLCAGGAFAIIERIPTSVRHVLESQLRMSGVALLSLACQVAQGLDELGKTASRAHGNLKPSNVLLRKENAVTGADVALTDPIPTAAVTTAHRAADIECLGRMIYQLAMRMPSVGQVMHPVADAPEWEELGRHGTQVRQICDVLLDPDVEPEAKWTHFTRLLARRQRNQKLLTRTLAAACVGVVLAGAGLAIAKHPQHLQTLAFWRAKTPTTVVKGDNVGDKQTGDTTRGISGLPTTRDDDRGPVDQSAHVAPVSSEAILAGLMKAGNSAAPFKLTIDAQSYRSSLGNGRCMGITLSADTDCYLLLLCRDASGKISLLLPNGRIDRSPLVGRGQRVTVQSFGFELPVEPPYGRTTFKVIATTRRVRFDGAAPDGNSGFMDGFGTMSLEDRSGTAVTLDKLLEPRRWNTAEVDVTTSPNQ